MYRTLVIHTYTLRYMYHIRNDTLSVCSIHSVFMTSVEYSHLKPRLHDATFVEQHWWILSRHVGQQKSCGRPFNIVDPCSLML